MSTWSPLPFGNDDAADWSYELEDPDDLEPITRALDDVLSIGDTYLESFEASAALAAIEMLACLGGRPGDTETYTEAADAWLRASTVRPPAELLVKARAAIDRVLADRSELREEWRLSEDAAQWLAAVADLRVRVTP